MNKGRKIYLLLFAGVFCCLSCSEKNDQAESANTFPDFPFHRCSEVAFIPGESKINPQRVAGLRQSTEKGVLLLTRGEGYNIYYFDEENFSIRCTWKLADSLEIIDYETDHNRNLYVLEKSLSDQQSVLQSFDSAGVLRWSVRANDQSALFSNNGMMQLLARDGESMKWILQDVQSTSGRHDSSFRILPGSPPFLPFTKNTICARRGTHPEDGWIVYALSSGDTSSLTLKGETFLQNTGIDSAGRSVGIFSYSNGFMLMAHSESPDQGWKTEFKNIVTDSTGKIFVDAGEYVKNDQIFKKVVMYNHDTASEILLLPINRPINAGAYDFVLEKSSAHELEVAGYSTSGDKDLHITYDHKGKVISTKETENLFLSTQRFGAFSAWRYTYNGRLLVPVESPGGIHLFSFSE
jgi:hypothetical protein